jgi:uncharacterized protein (DUF4415 family)
MIDRKKPAHISQEDWDDVDSPELTDEELARSRPAREVFPDLDFPKPRPRGPQKAPTKVQTTLRFDRDVVEHFRAGGCGWQTRLNTALRRLVEAERKTRA